MKGNIAMASQSSTNRLRQYLKNNKLPLRHKIKSIIEYLDPPPNNYYLYQKVAVFLVFVPLCILAAIVLPSNWQIVRLCIIPLLVFTVLGGDYLRNHPENLAPLLVLAILYIGLCWYLISYHV